MGDRGHSTDRANRADSLRHDLTEISPNMGKRSVSPKSLKNVKYESVTDCVTGPNPRDTGASKKNRGKQESVTLFINAVGSVAVARVD